MQPRHRGHKITAEDEEHLSAAALAKSTRLGHGMDDIDKNFAKNITSKRKFKLNDINPDDEHDFGVGVDLYTKQCATLPVTSQFHTSFDLHKRLLNPRVPDCCEWSAIPSGVRTSASPTSTYRALLLRAESGAV